VTESYLQVCETRAQSGWGSQSPRLARRRRCCTLDPESLKTIPGQAAFVGDGRHLKRLLFGYISYYHEDRTHLGLGRYLGPRAVKPEATHSIINIGPLARQNLGLPGIAISLWGRLVSGEQTNNVRRGNCEINCLVSDGGFDEGTTANSHKFRPSRSNFSGECHSGIAYP
jgi:hypothetical protein